MSGLVEQCKKIIGYLWGKKGELQDMDARDALLAKVVLDIHRKRTQSDFVMVPLFSLLPIHPINRENALIATQARIDTLTQHRDELTEIKLLPRDILNRYMPSVSGIKTVRISTGCHIAFEGNGRLYALQNVFNPGDGLVVEVEQYQFDNSNTICRRIERVRRTHGLDKIECPEFSTTSTNDAKGLM
ncbi:hypothetical protein [Desulfosediminicola sp.]|uniref:hypothetical protein n=1 Tax=Desulfosediminicola sp. TaxID=2886825 RepID=UPI003AF311E7